MAEAMTSRERVLAAVSHRRPDRVPIDLGATRDSSIVAEGYERIKEHFGARGKTELCDRMMQAVVVDERILRELGIDTRAVLPGNPTRGLREEDGPDRYRDVWGVERVRPPGSYYFDQVRFPLSGEITVQDIAAYPWPDPDDPGYVRGLRERIGWIRANTGAAAVLNLPAPFVHVSQYLRGYEDWYADFIVNPGVMEALFDAILEVTMEVARRELEAAGADADIIFCADDLGVQSGLMMSRDHYVKHIKPRHAKYFRQIHDMSPAKVLFHSCGSVAAIVEDLIEIGVDILNPVQVTAAGMEPAGLKKKYAGRMAFWGAMDSQNVLPSGGVGDVERMVAERIEQMGEGGGYVLACCHNIQPDVPLENMLAMFRRAREYEPSFQKG